MRREKNNERTSQRSGRSMISLPLSSNIPGLRPTHRSDLNRRAMRSRQNEALTMVNQVTSTHPPASSGPFPYRGRCQPISGSVTVDFATSTGTDSVRMPVRREDVPDTSRRYRTACRRKKVTMSSCCWTSSPDLLGTTEMLCR